VQNDDQRIRLAQKTDKKTVSISGKTGIMKCFYHSDSLRDLNQSGNRTGIDHTRRADKLTLHSH